MNEPLNSLTSMGTTWSACNTNMAFSEVIAGSHILGLLRKLKMPLVTTLHTVLREPDSNQRAVLEEIAHLSDRLIVMSEHAALFCAMCMTCRAKKSMSFPWRAGPSVHGSQLLQGPVWYRGQIRLAYLRPAVSE